MPAQRASFNSIALALLGLAPLAFAHGHGSSGTASGIDMSGGHASDGHSSTKNFTANMSPEDVRIFSMESYFAHTEHSGVMFAHIALMLLAWVVFLPIAVMFSVARSRLTLPVQVAFLAVNGIGILTSVIYDHQTPDLYENNSHHKLGWAVTWIASIWAVMGIVSIYSTKDNLHSTYQPVTSEDIAEHQTLRESQPVDAQRWSGDSGQGSERNTASLFTNSRANSWSSEADHFPTRARCYKDEDGQDEDGQDEIGERLGFISTGRVDRFLHRHMPQAALGRTLGLVHILYAVLDKTLLLLGFLAIVTGVAVYGGIARSHHILNVLAHFIKGGIFFWYGLLTFGRWLGCFADLGWAWNIKPGARIVGQTKARLPTAEFTESFVIWFYGASNVFLEHLTNWGEAWSPMDLEHVSLTIMFFGGGMLGMLIESKSIRNLLDKTLRPAPCSRNEDPRTRWQPPDSYVHSLNPIPGLVIMLLGILMSSHSQNSMVSSMIHKQWGTLFSCFALARGVTYITLWLKPPQSYLASRPPSELVTSFCLISGGLIFMASNADTVQALEYYGLMANFIFTIVMGLTSLLMAWMVVVIALKAWAVRRVRGSEPLPTPALSAA